MNSRESEIRGAVTRIASMESCLDAVREALVVRGRSAAEDRDVRGKIRILITYMDNGRWLKDYELDEAGLLPEGMKRGVLSEDALYDLLTEFSPEKNI